MLEIFRSLKVCYPEQNTFISLWISHTRVNWFSCNQYTKEFSKPSRLNLHMLVHTGEKQFVCSHCNKAFAQSGYLKSHKLSHTGAKHFACDQCNKTFFTASHLKTHKLYHKGDKKKSVTCVTKLSLLPVT